MRLADLRIGGDAAQWRELGFSVGDDGAVNVGSVRLELTAAEQGAVESWGLESEAALPESIDGLATRRTARAGVEVVHPNGVTGIDHLVVFTPSLERTTAAFVDVGVDCRRVREPGGDIRQGFFIVADLLVEVVEGVGLQDDEPARFWGVTMVVADLDAAASVLGDRLGAIKEAVQPGRRIATVVPNAVGGLPLALITPRLGR
jgi:hypothetical protein